VVGEEHYDLDKDYRDQEAGEFEVIKVRRDWERDNATGENRPCQGVNDLHGTQGLRNGGLILANHAV
jgi:hypothetical protein